MASVASVSTGSFAVSDDCVVTKPSGLATGDLMVLHYLFSHSSGTMGNESGWTHEVANATVSGDAKTGVMFKVADAGDVAASNFTFDLSTSCRNIGAIYRITGYVTNDLLNESSQTSSNATPPVSFATGVTPITAQHLLLFLLAGGSLDNSVSALGASGYAVATNDPTWAEHYDVAANEGGGTNFGMAGASAVRSSASATGAFSVSTISANNDGTSDYRGILIAIGTPTDAPGTNALLDVSPTFFSQAGSAGTIGTSILHEASPAFFDASGTGIQNTNWDNETKPTTDWVNEQRL